MKSRRALLTSATALAALFLVSTNEGWAQSTAQTDSAVRAYWTAERLKNAIPKTPLLTNTNVQSAGEAAAVPSGPVEGSMPPTVSLTPSMAQRLYTPAAADAGDDVEAERTSSVGQHFTTSRVFPDAAVSTYPYLATGKLFFVDGGSNFVCSASVIRSRIVITAGHCVYNTVANRYHTNFLFVPALINGVGPTGSWTVNGLGRLAAAAWIAGNGSLPNSQDVAVLDMNDKVFNRVVRKIAFMTGRYGFGTGGLRPNHITILGYPCNLDNCQRMQQTGAGDAADGGNNTVRYGSAQRGGTSGGPWLQDFGIGGANSAHPAISHNIVRSVSSYGFVATEPKMLGGSILNAGFTSILNSICARRAGNCP